jgi:transcriptional regulator with XRE-family HTH domain
MREAKGWSQAKLAGASDMGVSGISQIETGARNPSVVTLTKIAEALGVEVTDLFPKGRRSSLEPSLFNGLEGEQRENVYEPWAEFVNSFVDRWERKIDEGVLDHGSVMEFVDILGDLMPVLGPLAREEQQEQPAEYPDTFGPVAGAALNRLLDMFNPLIEAATRLGEDSDLARLRQRREQMASEQDRAASG